MANFLCCCVHQMAEQIQQAGTQDLWPKQPRSRAKFREKREKISNTSNSQESQARVLRLSPRDHRGPLSSRSPNSDLLPSRAEKVALEPAKNKQSARHPQGNVKKKKNLVCLPRRRLLPTARDLWPTSIALLFNADLGNRGTRSRRPSRRTADEIRSFFFFLALFFFIALFSVARGPSRLRLHHLHTA